MTKKAYFRVIGISAAVLVGICVAGSGPALYWQADSHMTGFDPANESVPLWSGESFVAVERNLTGAPIVHVFNRSGAKIGSVPFAVPGARTTAITGYTLTPSGRVAVCGMAYDEQGRVGAFLGTVAADGSEARITQVNPYKPQRIAAAPDGTLWTIGLIYDDDRSAEPVLRHYDARGMLLGGQLPQNRVAAEMLGEPGYLLASETRSGWYTGPRRGTSAQYYEVQPDGTGIWFPGLPIGAAVEVTGVAMSRGGSVWASAFDPQTRTHRLYALDRAKSRWTAIDIQSCAAQAQVCAPGMTQRIAGAAEDGPVLAGNDRFTFRFFRLH